MIMIHMTLVAFVLALSSGIAQAVVAPISPGENLWSIISRIDATNATTVTTLQSLAPTCTVISVVPYTITAAGKYCLGNNVTVTGANTAIFVAASNVYLDLNNKIITGSGGTTFGVRIVPSGRSDVTVRNGTITGTNTGISVESAAPTVVLENINIIQAVTTGISSTGNSNGILMSNVGVYDTPTGINLNGSDSCVLDGCIINGSSVVGLNLSNTATFNAIKNCIFKGGASGIVFDASSIYNCIIGCSFSNQTTVGVNFNGSFYDVLDATTFNNIGTVATQYAVNVASSTGVLLRECVFDDNQSGVNADSSTNVVITGCSISGLGTGTGISGTTAPTIFVVNNIVRNHTTNYNGLPGATPIIAAASVTSTNAGYWTNISG